MKKEKKKTKKSKKGLIISVICILILLIGGSIGGYLYYQNYKEEQLRIKLEKKKREEEKKLLNAIKSNYSEYVTVTNDTKLYKLKDKKYEESGQVSKGSYLVLAKDEEITLEDEYFKLANIDYYISYKDITPAEMQKIDNKYKNYVPFDFDIITKNPTNFYLDDKLIYSINNSVQLPVIINDSSYYYVEFDNKLLGIKKDNIEKTVEAIRNVEVASKIGVLNYHFFYDPNIGESCNETICLKTSKFEEQLKYLKDNGFYTATMNDMSLWMEKKIRLPKKTTVLTVDDGALGTNTHLIDLLEKYDLHGTLFLITAWWSKDNYISDNLEIQSHGNDIHDFTKAVHPALTMTKEQLLNDFKISIDALDGEKTAFCYPFYAHNETVRSAVRESGFKIAFVGGNIKATQNNNPYMINRYVILSNITLNRFISMVN